MTEDKTTIKILSRINEFNDLSHYCEGVNQGIITTGDKIFMLQGEINGEVFTLGEVRITPLNIIHGKLEILGYKLNNCAYITDCSGIPNETKRQLKNLDILILNALGFDPHPTHFSLNQSLDAVAELKPKRAIFTHINHKFDHATVMAKLPKGVELAYDGMTIEC